MVMTKVLVILIAFMFFSCKYPYSQDVMKKKKFKDIEFFELTDKERVNILKENHSVKPENYKGDYIYRLSNGRILFEMKDIVTFLFLSEEDFNKYIESTESPQPIGDVLQTYTHPIQDSSFIEKREMYIAFFAGVHQLEIDLADPKDLAKLDKLLNLLDNQELKKYRLSIVAMIGEFIVANLPVAEWKYLNISYSQKERVPVILVDEKTLINPANIFYEEYNKRVKNPNHVINITKSVLSYIKK